MSSFTIDEDGIRELFQSPRGDVYKYMKNVGQRVTLLAKRHVGKKSHALERSIGWSIRTIPGGVLVEVAAKNHVALLHHQGTRRHVISARPGRLLRFRQGGRVVYAQQIVHPGTRPNPYLVTALREVVK